MAMAGTSGGLSARARAGTWMLVALLLAIVVAAVVAVVVLDDPPDTGLIPASEPRGDRQEVTERLVNEGYLPKAVLD